MTQINDDNDAANDASTDSTAKDYDVQNYQDEIDTDPNKTDPVMNEQDDPVVMLGVPADELRSELDKLDIDDPDTTDDMREEVEDLTENDDEPNRAG